MTNGLAAAVIAVLFSLSGCNLYFGGHGDDDDDCLWPANGGAPLPERSLRDPNTGLCQYIGGDGMCPAGCGPCAYEPTPPLPDWGMCYGVCDGLDETQCQATPACYAAYKNDAPTDGPPEFWGCWNTAPSGPERGECKGLDAYECSRHDDCIAIYSEDSATETPRFALCAPEPTQFCVTDDDCGGSTCDHTICYPSPTCTPCETCGACPDSNTCYGVCVPTPAPACEALEDEASCLARTDCVPVYDGDQCTCYPDGCDCKVQTYARCETP